MTLLKIFLGLRQTYGNLHTHRATVLDSGIQCTMHHPEPTIQCANPTGHADTIERGPPAPPSFRIKDIHLTDTPATVHGLTPLYRPPKQRVPVDNLRFVPPTGYNPPPEPMCTEPYHIKASDIPQPPPSLNADYIEQIAELYLSPGRADYTTKSARHGCLTRCQRERSLTIIEQATICPDTPEGDKWDEFLAGFDDRGLLYVSDKAVLPGTQTLKPGVAVKFVFPNSEKLRPTVDGSFPQQTGTSRTAWTPINELRYRTDRINEVIALAIVHDIGSADLQDYIKAFTQLRRHPSELSLNCIYWRGKYHYSWACFYGESSTPANAELIFDLVQIHSDKEIEKACGVRHPISRRVDDSLLMHPRSDRGNATLASETQKAVTAKSGLQFQPDKEELDQTKVKFDGYVIDFEYKNPYGKPGAIGIQDIKQAQLRSEIVKAKTMGLSKKQSMGMTGRMEHAAIVCPNISPRIGSIKACESATPYSGAKVRFSPEARSDLDYWQHILQPANASVFWTPFYHHFLVGAPQIQIYTDGSGHEGSGGWCSEFWYSERWEDKVRTVHNTKDKRQEVDNSTWSELAALYLMLSISGSKWSGQVVQWNTDSGASEAIYFKTRSRNKRLNRLVKLISAYCHSRAIIVYPVWRSRDRNVLADLLSKGDTAAFLSQLPSGVDAIRGRRKWPRGAARKRLVQSL